MIETKNSNNKIVDLIAKPILAKVLRKHLDREKSVFLLFHHQAKKNTLGKIKNSGRAT